MNIIKIGGSIVNPDGKYDTKVIEELIALFQKSKEKFILVIGGGKICRMVQEAAWPFFNEALPQDVAYAGDTVGIAVTRINAWYMLQQFQKKLEKIVYPEILLDPTQNIKSKARIFFIGGWKPGHSTDKDMMLLAKTFKAEKVIKISNFEVVKKINPLEFHKLSDAEKKRKLELAEDLTQMSWKELWELVGTRWVPGLNTPFDPRAVEEGYQLRKKLVLYIGRLDQLPKMLKNEKFRGTVVKG